MIVAGHATFHTWVSHLAVALGELRCGGQHSPEVYRVDAEQSDLGLQPAPSFTPRLPLCFQPLPGNPASPPPPCLVAGSSTISPCCATLCRGT